VGPIVVLGAHDATVDVDVERLRADFNRKHYLRLPGLIAPELLERVLNAVDVAEFDVELSDTFFLDHSISPDASPVPLLHLLVNCEPLFRFVGAVTGCPRVRSFSGRVFRIVAGSPDHLEWHRDLDHDRFVALSLSLARTPCVGGALSLRRTGTEDSVSIANPRAGDAVLFRVDPRFEHRVEPVLSGPPRVAFSGWFSPRPFSDALRQRAAGDPG